MSSFKGAVAHHDGTVQRRVTGDRRALASKGPSLITTEQFGALCSGASWRSVASKGPSLITTEQNPADWRTSEPSESSFKGAVAHHDGTGDCGSRRDVHRRHRFKGAVAHHDGTAFALVSTACITRPRSFKGAVAHHDGTGQRKEPTWSPDSLRLQRGRRSSRRNSRKSIATMTPKRAASKGPSLITTEQRCVCSKSVARPKRWLQRGRRSSRRNSHAL